MNQGNVMVGHTFESSKHWTWTCSLFAPSLNHINFHYPLSNHILTLYIVNLCRRNTFRSLVNSISCLKGNIKSILQFQKEDLTCNISLYFDCYLLRNTSNLFWQRKFIIIYYLCLMEKHDQSFKKKILLEKNERK